MDSRAIGVFDSGLGGLCAVRELEKLLGAPSRTVEQWYYARPSRPASWVVRLIVEKCAQLHDDALHAGR